MYTSPGMSNVLNRALHFIFGPHTFEVLAFFLAAAGIAFALSSDRDDVVKANWFLGAAFLLALGRSAHLMLTWKETPPPRYVLSFLLFGAIGVGWVIVYDWVGGKLQKLENLPSAVNTSSGTANQPTPPQVATSPLRVQPSVDRLPDSKTAAPTLPAKPPVEAALSTPDDRAQAEIERRRLLLDKLRNEYILSHDNISPAPMAGTEQPPPDWTNKRLGELGEKWRIPTPQASLPISKTLRFTAVVPINESSKNVPVPINTNSNDPKSDFYQDLLGIAGRPDQVPEGTTYKERKLDTPGDKFVFITRLIQYYVLHSLRVLQGGRQGTRWIAGKGVTAIDVTPIPAPDAVPYSTDTLIHDLGDNEFLTQSDRMLWKARPFQLPNGTIVSLKEKPSGGPLECTVRFERPEYYRIDFIVSPSISMTGQPPAGFESTLTGVSSYPVTVTMTYEIQKRGDGGFEPEIYARWADELFSGLKNIMAP